MALASIVLQDSGVDVELITELQAIPGIGDFVTPQNAKWGDHTLLGQDLLVIGNDGPSSAVIKGKTVPVTVLRVQPC